MTRSTGEHTNCCVNTTERLTPTVVLVGWGIPPPKHTRWWRFWDEIGDFGPTPLAGDGEGHIPDLVMARVARIEMRHGLNGKATCC